MEVRSGAREEAKGKTENKDVVPGGGSLPAWVRETEKDLHSEGVGLLCILEKVLRCETSHIRSDCGGKKENTLQHQGRHYEVKERRGRQICRPTLASSV